MIDDLLLDKIQAAKFKSNATNLLDRLVKINPTWYTYISTDVLYQVYGVDTGKWYIEHPGGLAEFPDKKSLFELINKEL